MYLHKLRSVKKWRKMSYNIFGGDLIWRMGDFDKFSGDLIWQTLAKFAEFAKFNPRQN